MILTCPSCSTRYFADDTSLPRRARRVRCAACGHAWRAGGRAARAAQPKAYAEPAPGRPLTPGAPDLRAALLACAAAGAGVLMLTALSVAFRVEVVGLWPRMATAYAAAGFTVTAEGLVFEQIAAAPGYEAGEPTLTVTAVVRNTTGRPRDVPAVGISLLSDLGEELFSWSVALGVSELRPRQAVRFTAKLAQPPADAADLELRFTHHPTEALVPVATEPAE